jgi:hypothetical protein
MQEVNIPTDDCMFEALRNGGFRRLLNFDVTGGESLSMSASELLLRRCEHLATFGNLQTWNFLNPQFIAELRKQNKAGKSRLAFGEASARIIYRLIWLYRFNVEDKV